MGYINIGSLGNAQYFGELTNSRQNPGACSSSTRGLWGGGTPGFQIDYVTIASAGNAIDFGDLSVNRYLLRDYLHLQEESGQVDGLDQHPM